MILRFNCPPAVKAKVDALVQAGRYPGFSTFCVVALENQLLLEDESSSLADTDGPATPAGLGTPDESSRHDGIDRPRSERRAARSVTARRTAPGGLTESAAPSQPLPESGVPSECSLARVPDEAPGSLRESLPSVFSATEVVPVERWLLGHYNRLLPAKVSCRVLVNLMAEGRSPALDEIAPLIAEVAAKVGEHLRRMDELLKSHRDDALSIAFPELGQRGAKGRLRYQNHFVGQMVKGQQEGLLVGLKLAAIEVKKNRPIITPTRAGWEFAKLRNPVLDEDQGQLESLSNEEIDFMVGHIVTSVPVELFAYRLILSLVARGKDSPDAANQALLHYVDAAKLSGDVQTYLSTQRGGVLGRMKDLQLIERERIGTSFRYHTTERGAAFLASVGEVR